MYFFPRWTFTLFLSVPHQKKETENVPRIFKTKSPYVHFLHTYGAFSRKPTSTNRFCKMLSHEQLSTHRAVISRAQYAQHMRCILRHNVQYQLFYQLFHPTNHILASFDPPLSCTESFAYSVRTQLTWRFIYSSVLFVLYEMGTDGTDPSSLSYGCNVQWFTELEVLTPHRSFSGFVLYE